MKKITSVKGEYGIGFEIGGSEIRDLQGLLNSRRTQVEAIATNGFGAPEHKMEFVKNIPTPATAWKTTAPNSRGHSRTRSL